jgi:tetratricopeptide (TPR) repeat protein
VRTIAYYNRGRAYERNGSYDKAIPDLTRYVSSNISNKEYVSDGYNERGLCYKNSGRPDDALGDFNRATSLFAGNWQAFYNRGGLYSDKRSWDAAVADFTTAISLNPGYAAALVGRGLAYNGKNDDTAAIADFTRAIQVNPNEAEAYYNRAKIFGWRKDYTKAISDYDKYVSLNASNTAYLSDGYLNKGLIYADIDNLDQAVKDITAAIDLNPANPKPYKARAFVYRKQDKVALAEADERRAAELERKPSR